MASVAPAPSTTGRAHLAPAIPARARLRVGVVADARLQPRWIVESLAKVAASGFADLACIDCENRGQTSISNSRKSGSDPGWMWRAYAHADRKVFGGATDWSQPSDIAQLVPASRRCALAACEGEPLDVIVAVGAVDDASLDGLARYGVWRHCFGEGQGACEGEAGVREVVDGAAVTASGIRVRRGLGAPDRIAYQSWSRTLAVSVAKSRANVFAKASEFLVRALNDVRAGGEAWLDQRPVAAPTIAANDAPTFIARDLARMGARVAGRTAQKLLGVEQWSLAFRFIDIEPWNGSLEGFFRIEPPKDRFWADPFPIQRFGKSYIFFEELPFASGKAHISVVEVDREGRASQPVRVLERDYHLSYPFLFEDEGELFMIPETGQNQTVELYRCVDFPRKWKLERVLLRNVCAADATLHREGGRLWMFANCATGFEMHDELHLFSADSLTGEWKPHRRNPVKSDVRSARPAGKLFTQGGKLYRPSQICAPLYGTGVAINRVTRLDAEAFTEETERRIVPAPGSAILGLHTINRAGDLSVIDAFARRPRF